MKKSHLRRAFKIVFILASIGSLAFVPWILVKAWILPLPDTVQAQVEEAIEHGFDGAVVYVQKGQEAPKFYAAGWKNKEKKIPADPHALFKIASISKLYHAAAIAKLVHAKKLSLDKTLADYFPELQGRIENAESITLRWMVQHKSGIPNFTDTPNYWANPPKTDKENLELAFDLPANFVPGEGYGYSNTNYLLLGMLIEKVTGANKNQYIQEQIITPLGLKQTFFSVKEVEPEAIMSGYHVGYPYDLKEENMGMVASAQDVGTFLRALNDGSLLNDSEQTIYSSIYQYEHSGWVPGYQSFAHFYKEQDAVVVHFYSTTDPDLLLWNVSEIVNTRIEKIIQN